MRPHPLHTSAAHAALALALVLGLAACGEPAADPAHTDEPDVEQVYRYVRGDEATRLLVEVDAVSGVEPTLAVIIDLEDGLASLLDKPDGVEVVLDDTIAPRGADYAWTHGEVVDLAESLDDLPVAEGEVKIHVLFLDGHDASDAGQARTLGLSWSNRHALVFKQTIDTLCRGEESDTLKRRGLVERACNQTELAIWSHELGHVVGLVDNGLPLASDHEDAAHPGHDVNEGCLMHWSYDTPQAFYDIRGRLNEDDTDDAPLSFCQPCLQDVAAAQAEPATP